MTRRRIYEIIEVSSPGDRASRVYDGVMIAVILLSLVPLTFKETNLGFHLIEWSCTAVFLADYFPRLLTADLKLKRGRLSFLLYPFTPMALVDLLAILPAFFTLSASLRLVKLLRLFRALRSVKLTRYSRSIRIIVSVVHRQRAPLLAVASLAAGYILLSALVIFNVEPETFDTFFDAVYWATISLTTMGYGDIYPVTTTGRIVTMLSSFVGIAIVALPAGVITAGYMEQLRERNQEEP